jgi:hypothetical protein
VGRSRLLARQEIVLVQCFGGALFNRAHRELGIEDMATIVLHLSDGAVAGIVVGRGHTPNHPSHGVVVSPLDDENALIRAATDRFVDRVRHGVDPGQTYRDSLPVMEASFADEDSLHNGGKVVSLADA